MRGVPFSRREAIKAFSSFVAASPLLRAQVPSLVGKEAGRIAPMAELVNSFEFGAVAEQRLDDKTFALIADGERDAFERMTLHQRLLIDTTQLDLTTDLFGDSHFAPILVGPAAHQNRFDADGELAAARGASAAKAVMVVADRSDQSVEDVAAQAEAGFWYQVYPDSDADAMLARVRSAVDAGSRAVCLTVGAYPGVRHAALDWDLVARLRDAADAPLLLKGVMSPGDALKAADNGVDGIVVSNHGGLLRSSVEPIEALPSVAEAVAGRIPLILDGGIRRGSDVLKAMALGATAAFVTRPVLWGLAAYGSDGIQTVLEMLQTELGRAMTMLGTSTPSEIKRDHVRIHKR